MLKSADFLIRRTKLGLDLEFTKRTIIFLGAYFFLWFFWLALSMVYLIPQEWMLNNILRSVEILEQEGNYPISHLGFRYDNYTAIAMLKQAMITGDNPFIAALSSSSYSDPALSSVDNIRFYI